MTAAIAPIASNGPAAAKAAGPSATPASPLSSAMAKHRQELGTLATTLPFFAYTACFLLAPTVIVIVGAFQDRSGNFTLANFNKMFEANTIAAFGTSILVCLASSLIGAVVGALASYALVIGAKPNGLLRRMVSAISSVLAQFGGVMLAFAFIATIGINGIGPMLIKTLTGYTVNPNWLSSLPGLVTIYCYFQIPLMIIIFLPAVDSIRPQWREACESLGGNTFQYWTRVACPILAPRFISAFLLLFASAFSAYATAAALFSQRSILVPLMIQGAMRNELDPNQQGFAQVLEECRVGQPEMPLYSNRTGAVYEGDPKPLLSQQIASPVRWETIVRNMIAAGADTFVELGPGKTLCGLIEKIDKTVKTYALSTQADLETILKEVKGC